MLTADGATDDVLCIDVLVCRNDYRFFFFFFKQKTAYEIKECDWSSDVCSSDLLTALTYVLVGRAWGHFMTWAAQARQWKGRNAGWVMACGAGGMRLKLGGAAVYHGHEEIRPWLGKGYAPTSKDIGKSIRFLQQGMWLWLGVLFLGGWLSA